MGAADLTIDAPPRLGAAADMIRAVDLAQLEADLRRAGLALPARINVLLMPEDDPRARTIPRWTVGLAAGEQDLVILPQRLLPYPHDSVESVFRHEVVHLALSARAGGRCRAGFTKASPRPWTLAGTCRASSACCSRC